MIAISFRDLRLLKASVKTSLPTDCSGSVRQISGRSEYMTVRLDALWRGVVAGVGGGGLVVADGDGRILNTSF